MNHADRGRPQVAWGMSLLTALLVAVGSYLVNPGYYGDAPQYASDVLGPLLIPRIDFGLDSGHLVWRPILRRISEIAGMLGASWDGLTVLRVLAAAAMGLIVLGIIRLGAKLDFTVRQQLLSVLVLAGTSSTLLVGGSGAPYTSMGALMVLSVVLVTPPPSFGWGRGVAGALCMGAACTFWGVGIMLLPAFCVATFLGHGGTFRARSLAAIGLSALAGCFAAFLAWASWAIWIAPHDMGFLTWLGIASHGAESAPSLIGAARAVLGSMRAFIDLGDLGYAVKAFLLGRDGSALARPLALAALVAALLGTAVLLTVWGALRIGKAHSRALDACVIGLAAWLPSFLFTVSYGGNEVHMIFGAVPFVALALVAGLEALSPRLAPALATVMILANLGLMFSPGAVNARRVRQGVGDVARGYLPAFSALIVTGQDFIYSESLPILLRDSIRVVNVRTDVLQNGADNWQARLDSSIALSQRLGGRIAVLSDLIGEPTPAGLKHLSQEQPVPSAEDLQRYFDGWSRGQRWSTGKFTFVELLVPDSGAGAP